MKSAIKINESAEAQRVLMEKLEAVMMRCGAEDKHLALILIELARRGELEADGGRADTETAFRELLRAVEAHCGRHSDCVLRVSNERIAAVCPDTHAAGASHVAARIREAAVFLPSRRGLPLPLAMGIVVSGPKSGESAGDILLRARRTLEAAHAHPSSLVSVRGAGLPPRRHATLFSWIKNVLRGSSAEHGRRLCE